MQTILKRWGNSLAIVINAEFAKIRDYKEGDIIDYSEIHKVEKGGNKK